MSAPWPGSPGRDYGRLMGRHGLDAERQNNWRRNLRSPLTLVGGSLSSRFWQECSLPQPRGAGSPPSARRASPTRSQATSTARTTRTTSTATTTSRRRRACTTQSQAMPQSPSFQARIPSRIDLSFTYPNPQGITVPATAIRFTIESRQGCPAYPNFRVVHALTASVTLPGNTTRSLSALGIAPKDWPVITMVTTHATQDACMGTFIFTTRRASPDGPEWIASGSACNSRHEHVQQDGVTR